MATPSSRRVRGRGYSMTVGIALASVALIASCKSNAPTQAVPTTQGGATRELFRGQGSAADDASAPTVARKPQQASDRLAAPTAWPVSLSGEAASFVVHEPLVEQLDDGVMKARALVLARNADAQEPVAGSLLLRAIAEPDETKRLVALIDVQVLEASFPVAPERLEAWQEFLRASLPDAARTLPLAKFEAERATLQARQRAGASGAAPAPRVIVSERPAVLVYIDGDPRYVPLRGTTLMGVVNTRVLLLKDDSGTQYLHLYDGWVSAPSLNGPWQVAQPPPAAVTLEQTARAMPSVDLLRGKLDDQGRGPALTNAQLPQIIVSTQPAALIVLNGPPRFARIGRSALQYATNTTAHVLRNVATDSYYVRVRDEWLESKSLNGPWSPAPSGALKASFSAIPDDHPKHGLRAWLDHAQHTVVAADASTATLSMTLSGDPVLQPIRGSDLNYVANASVPIIEVDVDNWYATQGGVWFHSNRVTGPWVVTRYIPPEIYAIPRSSPIYHAIQSRALASSSEVTYFGYPTNGSLPPQGGAIGIEDQGADYMYTPPSSLHWNWVYR
jgi:hypothetical protein